MLTVTCQRPSCLRAGACGQVCTICSVLAFSPVRLFLSFLTVGQLLRK